MKKFLLAGISLAALLAGPALAADMPVLKGPVYTPAWTWTGFYVGLQAGYGWASNTTVSAVSTGTPLFGDPTPVIPVPPLSFNLSQMTASSAGAAVPNLFTTNPRGGNFGGVFGYNLQLTPRWVVGIEADLSDSFMRNAQSLTGTGAVTLPPYLIQSEFESGG